jgi:hypothetical protein
MSKTHRIELQRFKSATNSAGRGTVSFHIDCLVQPNKPKDDGTELSSVIEMSEADARVLLMLLKQQIAAFDARKPKSRF